jgi:cytochrome c biogenesis protein CcdA
VKVDDVTLRRRARARLGAVILGLVVVAVAGYVGFVAFVESNPGVGAGVMVLAAATGFAAFFSPCSFPLLLTFLTRRSTESTGSALVSALRVGAGAAVLLGLFAVGITVGGAALGRIVEFDSAPGRVFRLSIGLLLVVFGLRQSQRFGFRMQWLDRVAGLDRVAASSARVLDPGRASNAAGADFAYGFGYLLAGFG